jgi:hypothetical protein
MPRDTFAPTRPPAPAFARRLFSQPSPRFLCALCASALSFLRPSLPLCSNPSPRVQPAPVLSPQPANLPTFKPSNAPFPPLYSTRNPNPLYRFRTLSVTTAWGVPSAIPDFQLSTFDLFRTPTPPHFFKRISFQSTYTEGSAKNIIPKELFPGKPTRCEGPAPSLQTCQPSNLRTCQRAPQTCQAIAARETSIHPTPTPRPPLHQNRASRSRHSHPAHSPPSAPLHPNLSCERTIS